MPRLYAYERPNPDLQSIELLVSQFLSIPLDKRTLDNWGCAAPEDDGALWELTGPNGVREGYINGCFLTIDADYYMGHGLHLYIGEASIMVAFATFHGGNGTSIKGQIEWEWFNSRKASVWAAKTIEQMFAEFSSDQRNYIDIPYFYEPQPVPGPPKIDFEDVERWIRERDLSPSELRSILEASGLVIACGRG